MDSYRRPTIGSRGPEFARGSFSSVVGLVVGTAPDSTNSFEVAQSRAKLPPFPKLVPGGDQRLNRPRVGEVPRSDPTDEVGASIEALQRAEVPIIESLLCRSGQVFAREGLVGRLSAA